MLTEQRKFLVMVGYDKKAFYVPIDDKKTFPNKSGILPLKKRYHLLANEKILLYWEITPNTREPIEAKFKCYGM